MPRIPRRIFCAIVVSLVASFLSLPSVCAAAGGVDPPTGPGGIGPPPEQNGPAAYLEGDDFPDQLLGTTSKGEFFITSTGNQPLIITGFSFSGPNAANFSILPGADGCSGTTRYYDQECDIIVEFTPTAIGQVSATVTLEDNEPTPSSFTISGSAGGPTPPATTQPTATTPPAATTPTPAGTATTRSAPPSAPVALSLRSVRDTVRGRKVGIHYLLGAPARVKLSVSGPRRKARTVLTRTSKAGPRMIVWNGSRVPRGRYALTLTASADGQSVSQTVSVKL